MATKNGHIPESLSVLSMPISRLTMDPGNTRQHSERNIEAIKASIEHYGFRGVIVAQKVDDSEELIVRSGNGRLQALIELGYQDAPVLVVEGEPEDGQAYSVADNRTAELATWDFARLGDLMADGIVTEELGVGFSTLDISRVLAGDLNPLLDDISITDELDEPTAGLTDPDAAPEPPTEGKCITKAGDMWILGNHKLICGSATSEADVAKLMGSEMAGMVYTDPPYGISYKSNKHLRSPSFEKIENDDRILTEWLPLASKFSTGFCFTWTTWKVMPQWMEVIEPWSPITNVIVWHKGKGGLGDLQKTYSPDYELALVCNRGAELTGKRIGSVWSILTDHTSDYIHPTQKPVALAEQAIATTTRPGDIVLDFFGGSGSTMIACETLGRSCRMLELDPKYCDVIVNRWVDFTGREATRVLGEYAAQ